MYSPTTNACAGILHRSSDSSANTIDGNYIVDTQGAPAYSQGAGILLIRGVNTTVSNNLVGITHTGVTTGAGNLGNGIAATAGSGDIVSGLTISGNEVLGSGVSGIYVGVRADGSTVENNTVGLSAAFDVVGNTDDGIEIYASDDHIVRFNTVVGSGAVGISLSGSHGADWQSGSVLLQNNVGSYLDAGVWEAAGNTSHGIVSDGQEGSTSITENLVGANGGSGIRANDPQDRIQGNWVGVSPLSDVLSNSGSGIVVGGDNVLVGGEASWGTLPTLEQGNVVSANGEHGIVVLDDTSGVEIYGNAIGTDESGEGTAD